IRVLPTLSAPTTLRIQPSAFLSETDMARIETALDEVAALLHRGDLAALLAHLAVPPTTAAALPERVTLSRREVVAPAREWGGPRRVRFLANLPEAADLRRFAPELTCWSVEQFAALFERLRGVADPFDLTRQLVTSPTGATVEVCIIAVPVSAEQIIDSQR